MLRLACRGSSRALLNAAQASAFPSPRLYCTADDDRSGDETDPELLAKLAEANKFRMQQIQEHTTLRDGPDGRKRHFWNKDAPAMLDSDQDLGRLSDVDSNLDDGALEDNARYRAYNKHYLEKRLHDPDTDTPVALSGSAKEMRKERRISGKRDFHRHKILMQTGRTKDVSKDGLKEDYEPGYTPDYLPRLFNISDASEWVSDLSGRENNTEAEEEERLENPSKYDKLRRFRSPYWTTQRQLERSDGESEGRLRLTMHNDEDGAVDNENAEEDADMEGATDGAEMDDDEAALSEDSAEVRTPDEDIPFGHSSSTEDCPDDPHEHVDLVETKMLPPPEHDVQYRDDFLHQMLLKTGHHCKVTTGGRIFTSSALVLVGNGDGVGGLGYGKGESFAEAMALALKDAKRKLIAIYRVDNSVSYQSKQKYCRARVYVWPLAKKAGVRSAFKHQTICDLFGLTDIRIKTFGRRNDHNIYKALLRCLETSETPEMCARRRGKKVWDINKNWRVNNRARGY